MSEYSYRNSHLHKGDDYASIFEKKVHTSMMWELEQDILDRLIELYVHGDNLRALDFACGTGRITKFLAPRVESITGVDVSSSMLDVLRKNLPVNAKILECDLTKDLGVLDGEQFDLITSFRFFLNAEPELRNEVFGVVASLLKPDGIFIFNNHGNEGSLIHRTLKVSNFLKGRRTARHCMHRKEVYALADKNNFSIISETGLGVLPLTDRHMLLPWKLAKNLERNLAKMSLIRSLGDYVIYCAIQRPV